MEKRVLRKWALCLTAVFLWGILSPAWAGPLEILLPRPGDLVGGENILCVAEFKSTRRSITKVDFLVDDQVLSVLRYQPPVQRATATFIWDAREVSDGTHRLTVRAYAGGTIVGMDTVPVNVNNTGNDIVPPQVHIYFPHPDSVVSGIAEIGFQATDNRGVAMVTLFIDKQLKLLQNFPPYRYQWDTTSYPNGPHEIEVWAYDSAQNKGEARPVRVFVNNPAGRTDLKEIKEEVPQPPQKPFSEQLKASPPPAQKEIPKASPAPLPPAGPPVRKEASKPSAQKSSAPSQQQGQWRKEEVTLKPPILKVPPPPLSPQSKVIPPTKKTFIPTTKPREIRKAGPKDGQSSLAQPPKMVASPPTPLLITRIPQTLKRKPQMVSPVQLAEKGKPMVVEPRVSPPKLPEALLKEGVAGSNVPTKDLKGVPPPVRERKAREGSTGLPEETKVPLRKVDEGTSLQPKSPKPSPEVTQGHKPPFLSKPSERKSVPTPPQLMEVPPRRSEPALVGTPQKEVSFPHPSLKAELRKPAKPSPSSGEKARVLSAPQEATPSNQVRRAETKKASEEGSKGTALVARLPKMESLRKPSWEESPYRLRETLPPTPDLLRISLNDQLLDLDVAPWVQEGLTMVPFRQIFERSGGVVLWLPGERVVRAYRPGTQVEIKIGSPVGLLNGEKVIMDRPAFIKQGRTIVTLRFVATALNLRLLYDPERNLVRLFQP